jgi:ABC-type lipoprotein release transport system permease subunit
MIYLPSLQRYQGVLTLVARASAEGAAQAAAIRDAARSLDPRMAPYNIRTLAAEKGRSLSGRRGAAEIASVFGILCLVVSAVGLYGVMAQAVRQRTREIAIRIALGAAQTRTTVLVLRDAMILVGAALVPGLAGAFLASRLVSSMLYESEAIELLTVAAVIAILGVVALAAAWIPARRAATVNPIVALRGE